MLPAPPAATPARDTAASFAAHLTRLNACPEARRFAEGKTGATAWRTCHRGDWMLWLAAKVGVRREDVVLAACACARLALPHVPRGERRPLQAIETAESWAKEAGVTPEQARAAAAYAAAADAAAYAARAKTLRKCAVLVRKTIPWSTIHAALTRGTP